MSDHVLETIRATVQDFLAPEIRTHGVRLDTIDKRLEDTRHSLEQRIDGVKSSLEQRLGDVKSSLDQRLGDVKSSLEHRVDDTKETLGAEMRALDARMSSLENMIRSLVQQVSVESALRERVASLEARMPKQ